MLKIIIFFLLLTPLFVFSQNVTGIWKGELVVDSTKQRCAFELSISDNNGRLSGYTRISFEERGKEEIIIRDNSISKQDNQFLIVDDDQLSKASTISKPKEIKKIMNLLLSVQDTTMTLTGTWHTNKTRRFLAATGTIFLQRKKEFKETALFKKLDSIALTKNLSFNQPDSNKNIAIATMPTPPAKKIIVDTPTTKLVVIEEEIYDLPSMAITPQPSIATAKKNYTAMLNKRVSPFIKPIILPKYEAKKTEPVAEKTLPDKPSKEVAITKAIVDKKIITTKTIDKKTVAAVISKPTVIEKPKEVAVTKVEQTVFLPRANAAVDVENRKVSTMQTVYYKSDSLQITLYDNGEIDGDTVSVLLNGKILIARKGLDTKPNFKSIYFDKNTPDSMMLVMYAENLGSIPPNTGLLVVRDGEKSYEVRFSADLKTNAAIILRRKKEE